MSSLRKEIRVVIVGLGRVGSTFLKKFSEMEGRGVKIIATVEKQADAPGIKIAMEKGIPIYKATRDIIAMGESVDIIFDLTGNPEARRALRSELARSGNQHTVLAPEIIAYLVWSIMSHGQEFPNNHAKQGY